MPFEKYNTDTAGRRVQGVKLQGVGGVDKTSARGGEGIGKDT
jgi:hypothetical protein